MDRLRKIAKSPFAIFTVLMGLKIYLTWYVIFGHIDNATPLFSGLPSVFVAACLIELFTRKRKWGVYIFINALLTSIFFAAIMYYKYYGVIVTYHALQQANQVTQVNASVMSLMHPYFLLIYTDVVLFYLVYPIVKRRRHWRLPQIHMRKAWAFGLLALSFVICFASVWVNRGIINEKKKAQEMGIINYEVYTILSDMKKEPGSPEQVTREAIEKLKQTGAADSGADFGAAEGRNVIVIQLEAFQNFLLGLTVDGQEVTPVLNRLMKEHYYFPHTYFQAGQGNTSDAEYLLNTSFYIPLNGAAAQSNVDKDLPSLPKLFKDKGYKAVTFHTNDATFWNRKELYAALGFDRYYDKSFFGDQDVFHFGASDPVLYEKTAAEMGNMQRSGQKFYANIISMSSHHPFNLPRERDRITLPKKLDETFVGDYIRSENYADYALGLFFDELKANQVWDNSMIVIYGDHMGLPIYSLTENEKGLMKELLGREYSYPDMMNIPLIISVPGVTTPKVFPQTVGQIDFMPTIANLSGISLKDHIHFGQDVLNYPQNLLPMRYYLPSGSFINNDTIFEPGEGFQDGTRYPIGTSPTTSVSQEEYERALELLKLSDSYVRQLPSR